MTNSKSETFNYALSIAKDIENIYDGKEVDGVSDIYDYITENVLDVEYTLDSNKELIGVTLYVTLGGPTCWIDTRRQEVVCHWGSDSDSVCICSDVCDYINDFYRDMFDC